MQAAQAEMDSIAHGLVSVYAYNKDMGIRLESMQGAFYQGLKQPLTVLQGAVGFVLLIACANVAGLLLARAASRRTEMAVRSSLGAGRGRIVRQLLTESVLLAIFGGMLGALFAWVGLKSILASLPAGELPEVTLSGRVLAFTALVSIGTGLLFGLVPALQTSKFDLSAALKESTRAGSEGMAKQKLRGALVTAQIGLALVLLIGAGLMMNSFLRIESNDLGGDPKGLLTFDFRFPQSQLMKPVGQQYRGVGLWDISPNVALTYDRLFERLQGLPGVVSAAGASRPPFAGAMGMQFKIEGRPAPEPGPQGSAMNTAYMPVTPNYFATVRIPVLQGRDFSASDTASAPLVVIISKAMAQRWWANENPIGQRITFDFVPDEQSREIIGVVGDVRMNQTQKQPGPIVYLPHVQQSQRWIGPAWNYRSAMFYILRTSGNPTGMAAAVRSAVAEIDPSKPAGNLQTVEQNLRDQVSGQRVLHAAVDRVRSDCRLAGGGGNLRCDGVRGNAAHARDRHPHGAGRHLHQRPDSGLETSLDAGFHRPDSGDRRRVRAHPPSRERIVRGDGHRPGHIHRGFRGPGAGRRARQSHSHAPGSFRGPDGSS